MAPPPDAVGEVVLDADAIRAEVTRLGAQISADYAGRKPHLVGVLKGAAVFVADLIRAIEAPATLDFIAIVPYAEASRSGVVRIRKDLDDPIEGRDVIVVEGVCASGLSLSYLVRNFETRQPASIRICALLVKQRNRLGGAQARLRGARDPRRLRRGLRPRRGRALPQPALRRPPALRQTRLR